MRTILLAEDNADDVWIMQRALKSAGIEKALQVVENGAVAVEYLSGKGKYADREKFPLPCLLLLDMKMPYMSGLEVIEWVRKESSMPTLLTVFLTSSKDTRDIHQAYVLGANAYLVKPTEIGKLTEIIRSLNEFLLNHNETPPDVASGASS
jgi:CheY-like chemotaxis protein